MSGLPSNFDPLTGRFTSGPSRRPQRPQQPRTTTVRYTPSRWERFDDTISDWGYTLDEWAENVANYVMYGVAGLTILAVLAAIVITFVQEGFWMGILAIFLTLAAIGIVGQFYVIPLGICYMAAYIPMMIIRYIFYRGWTFVLAMVLALGLVTYFVVDGVVQDRYHGENTELVQNTGEQYRCTAAVLNARSGPGTKYSVKNKLKKGDIVEVYEITKGFARININGEDLYVSTKYLEKVK